MRVINLENQRFGMLEVISRANNSKNGKAVWNCRCDCGNYSTPRGESLRRGHATSCGCVRGAKLVKHNTTHGLTNSKEYSVWSNMKNRCTSLSSPYYKYYGGKGVKICSRWMESFENFYNDMGKCPDDKYSIDRIDVNGDYEPSNCRWSDFKEQANNKTSNSNIEYNGVTKNKKQWAEYLGVNYKSFWTILKSTNNDIHAAIPILIKKNLIKP